MARKYVRFNYFEVQLVPAQIAIQEEFEDEIVPYAAEPWDMGRFLDYLMANKNTFSTTVNIGDEYSEIEKDSYLYDEKRKIYSFQLSKLRETNIPSKKKFGQIKEQILLSKDEFIGEFNTLIYDDEYGALIMQSNLYGLTVKQTEYVLTQLRFRYLDSLNKTEENPLVVKLAPIIDRSKIERVLEANYYKKIRIKGADFMLDAFLDDNSLLNDVARMLNECSGVNIDITVSLGRSERTASLDNETIKKVLHAFNKVDAGTKPQIEITSLYDEDSDIETVNLIEPRMTDKISIEVAPRQTVAHEYLYYQFMEQVYERRRNDVRRVLIPIKT
jgi:hypothetical protein